MTSGYEHTDWTTFTSEPPMDTGLKELTELVRQIRNRCDIYLMIQNICFDRADVNRVVATLLEDIHEDSQTIIDEYCVVRDDD